LPDDSDADRLTKNYFAAMPAAFLWRYLLKPKSSVKKDYVGRIPFFVNSTVRNGLPLKEIQEFS
jgi:hypothetical protein